MTAIDLSMMDKLERKNAILELVEDPKKSMIFLLENQFDTSDAIQVIQEDVKALKNQCFKLPFKIDKKRAAGITTLIVGILAAIQQLC